METKDPLNPTGLEGLGEHCAAWTPSLSSAFIRRESVEVIAG